MSTPRIRFKTLKGFPPLVEQKIETEAFLAAAKELVTVIESFGKLFKPVINDMNGNITKLTKTYSKDKTKHVYLDDLLISNINGESLAGDALLWLKRGLQLICTFFEYIFYDTQCTEVLKHHLQNAYERTLKPYHGFIVQSTVKIIYNWVPTRSQLIGQGTAHDENVQALEKYLKVMRCQLDHIDELLKKYNLDVPKV